MTTSAAKLGITFVAVAISAASADEPDPHLRLLTEHGITPDAASIGEYLRSLHPGDDARKRQAALIRQLGDEDYFRREAAIKELLRLPVLSPELLQQAAESADAEVRWRARIVLKQAGQRSGQLLHAALAVIAHRELKGLAEPVLASLPFCTESYLRAAAIDALGETVEPGDADLLRRGLADKDPQTRIAAIRVFERLLGPAADGDLKPLCDDADDRIRVAVARALANHGNREALPVLGELLDSDDLDVRVEAVKVLRAASGQVFNFVAYEKPETRAEARGRWLAWIENEGRTASLNVPLKETRYELGRTIICNYSQHKIIEVNAAGEPVWEKATPGRYPWACQGLPNGHRLIAEYGAKTVTEYDADGKDVWRKAGLPGGPTSVERLENGNTLVACTDSGRVIEVDRAGNEVWSVLLASQRPTDARRLENGRTLVTLQNGNRVVEVDGSGKVVWEITGIAGPFSAERLENGNTLVACMRSGSVVEYDRAGKSVWSKTGLRYPYSGQRLSSGNTLIAHRTGVLEVNRDGHTVWSKDINGVSKAHRY